ncbi:Mariner Mos1 transposase [Eumeta japonica]|uniref:Mariner Mos1 transposase n=1 Tax=Eumeta variegata TaxID=151549 RepID=A0A4C1TX56_EUMVA|nr:Mariner Mos1 transposase [Eumeta japonica]
MNSHVNGDSRMRNAKARRFLVVAYNEAALSERTCRECFQKFKNGDFEVEDKDRSGRLKIYEDAELKELLEKDSFQTQMKLALTLEVTKASSVASFKNVRNDSQSRRTKGFQEGGVMGGFDPPGLNVCVSVLIELEPVLTKPRLFDTPLARRLDPPLQIIAD